MSSHTRVITCLVMFGLLGCAARDALALPSGRAWTPVEHLEAPHLTYAGGVRLEIDRGGIPQLICFAGFDTSGDRRWLLLLNWGQAAWVPKFTTHSPTGAGEQWPFLASNGKSYLEWIAPYSYGPARLLVAEIGEDGFGEPDTALETIDSGGEFSGAASARRLWLVRSDWRFPVGTALAIRTLYSDTRGVWHELPVLGRDLGIGEDHCTAAPLSDYSALVVYAGESGLGWARAEGDAWVEQGNLDSRGLVPAHPRLRFRPSGGLWLLWTERHWVHVSCYRDGRWSRGDSLVSTHPPGQTFWAAWCDASRDTAEHPVLVWSDRGYAYTYRDVACIAFPTDSGWATGEEIPGSENAVIPTVTRDLNGDAWVAWSPLGLGLGDFYPHTYTSATAKDVRIEGAGRHRRLAWTLSEPAPESWWAVLKSNRGGEFTPVARVLAGPGLEMSWADDSPPAGHPRYKVRRECVDTRYRWESAETAWPEASRKPIITGRIANPVASAVSLEVAEAAPGALQVRLYDLQGRVVLEQRAVASGERQRLTLEIGAHPASLPNGIYFLRVTDAAGLESDPIKLVILR